MMPLIVLPHPTSTLSGAEAEQKARAVVDEIVQVLTQDATLLSATYSERDYAVSQRTFRARKSLD